MSGGHFEYKQYQINDIIDTLEYDIKNFNVEDEDGYKTNYSQDVLEIMKKTLGHLTLARTLTHRLDYLFSGDDSEDSFFERLEEDLKGMLWKS